MNGLLNKLRETGFFLVFFSNVFGKILSLLGGVIIVRILSKSDYGLYTYVMNCYGMLFMLNDFGCSVAMMQFRSENYQNKILFNDYFTYALKLAMMASAVSSIFIIISPYFYPFNQEEAKSLTQFLFLLPIIATVNSFLSSNLRVEMQNKKFALLNFFQVVIHYGFILPLSFLLGVWGAVTANYVVAVVMLIVGIIISKNYIHFDWSKISLTVKQKKDFIKFALASQINNCMGVMISLFDVFLLGIVLESNEIISSYKVSSTIPQALMFIPNSIIIYALPLFSRNINNVTWVKRNYKRMILGCGMVNGVILIFCINLASALIPLIFGDRYVDAIPCFIILMISFFFQGTFHIPSVNIIYTQHKVKINIIITTVANVLNCILDIWLISAYGAIGAAMATLSVSVVSSLIAFGYMVYLLRRKGGMYG